MRNWHHQQHRIACFIDGGDDNRARPILDTFVLSPRRVRRPQISVADYRTDSRDVHGLFGFVVESPGFRRDLNRVEQRQIRVRHVCSANRLPIPALQPLIFMRRKNDEIITPVIGHHHGLTERKAANTTKFALKFSCGYLSHFYTIYVFYVFASLSAPPAA